MLTHMIKQKSLKAKQGFTLLELLIVITIIAILSVALVFILNPAETLQKSRDTQRLSDLSTLKTAIGIYLTATTTPQLDGYSGTANDRCDGGTAANERLWISVPTATETTNDATPPSGWTQANTSWGQSASVSAASTVDGAGWLPVKLTGLVGGSPISSMPLDPVNRITVGAVSSPTNITNSALMYRYACKAVPLTFEIDARLESQAYGVGGADDRAAKDGGNNANLFETGTGLTILPSTNDF
jgi:prepilin-type N-terminal cleavage/methylation domain-containing protein